MISIPYYSTAKHLYAAAAYLRVGHLGPPQPRLLGYHETQPVGYIQNLFAVGIMNQAYKITAGIFNHLHIPLYLLICGAVTAAAYHLMLAYTSEENMLSVKNKTVLITGEFAEAHAAGIEIKLTVILYKANFEAVEIRLIRLPELYAGYFLYYGIFTSWLSIGNYFFIPVKQLYFKNSVIGKGRSFNSKFRSGIAVCES